MNQTSESYDVVIMGGGPSGSTLAAFLLKYSDLKVLIVEKEPFPRDHIGESLAHPVIPILEESGALAKVMASDYWVKKFGGIFYWDKQKPSVAYFDHVNWKEDGVYRWSAHLNRSEFDNTLLQHAKSMGTDVLEGREVKAYHANPDYGIVELDQGQTIRTKVFVDASGRSNNIITGQRRKFLSNYKNMAIWNHYTNYKPAQSLTGSWNIFHDQDLSPIACFAFEHGWVWYIPVPKLIDGLRVHTVSIGIVTDPALLKDHDVNLRDPDVFLAQLRRIPELAPLIDEVVPVSNEMNVTANYSMINDKFCDFGERWIGIGDASYFVDPLFSSGVTFAGGMAATAALMIRETLLNDQLSNEQKAELWFDFDQQWHLIAASFALSIDQWYYAIAKNNPDSVFWTGRSKMTLDLGIRESSFHALVDTAINPDLLEVMTLGSQRVADLDQGGGYMKTLRRLNAKEPDDNAFVQLAADVRIRDGFSLDIPGFKGSIPPMGLPQPIKDKIAEYWRDPIANSDVIPSMVERLLPVSRFYREGQSLAEQIRFVDEREGGKALYEQLKTAQIYGDLKLRLSPPQRILLKHLVLDEMVHVVAVAPPRAADAITKGPAL
jgi:flavin-dependent dehydrogenase